MHASLHSAYTVFTEAVYELQFTSMPNRPFKRINYLGSYRSPITMGNELKTL